MIADAQKVQSAHNFIRALKTQDKDLMVSILAEDVIWTLPGASRISGEARGPNEVVERSRMIASVGMNFELKYVLSGFDGAALSLHNTASQGERVFDENLVTVLKLRGDRICKIDTYMHDVPMLNMFFAQEK